MTSQTLHYVSAAVGNVAIVCDTSAIGVGVRDRMHVHFDPFRFSEFDQSAVRVTSRWKLQALNVEGIELLTGIASSVGYSPRAPAPLASTHLGVGVG